MKQSARSLSAWKLNDPMMSFASLLVIGSNLYTHTYVTLFQHQ